jgi:hypothetical protein
MVFSTIVDRGQVDLDGFLLVRELVRGYSDRMLCEIIRSPVSEIMKLTRTAGGTDDYQTPGCVRLRPWGR